MNDVSIVEISLNLETDIILIQSKLKKYANRVFRNRMVAIFDLYYCFSWWIVHIIEAKIE